MENDCAMTKEHAAENESETKSFLMIKCFNLQVVQYNPELNQFVVLSVQAAANSIKFAP